MQKYNLIGLELLEYKKEYLNTQYSTIVHESIGSSIDTLFKENCISAETHKKLKDSNVDFEEFLAHMNEDPEFLLTTEEIISKYNKIIEGFKEVLGEYINLESLSFCPNLEKDSIEMSQEFIISEDFLKDFFDIPTEKDFDKLMERTGFVEKFAILRLGKVAQNILDEITVFTSDYKIFKTNTFYDLERNVYGIYIKYMITPDIFEDEDSANDDTRKTLCEKIGEIVKTIEAGFIQANIVKNNRVLLENNTDIEEALPI